MTHHKFPSWRYGPGGEAAVFESEDDVPKGWHDHPSKHEKSSKPAPAEPPVKPEAPAAKRGRKPKTAPLDL